jgi:protein phosphatase
MNVYVAGNTHVGMKRAHNEDSLFLLPEHDVYIVADGMGGHASGEVASKMAVETVADFFRDTAEDDEITWPYRMDKARHYEENRLINAIKLANLRIYEASSADPRKKGMGTTLVSVHLVNGGLYLGHVGDSRIYLIQPSGDIEQLTEDHSLLNDYIKMKDLTPEEIEHFPHKNVIVRALGMKETVMVDTVYVEPEVGDTVLLCSDGLTGMITDETLVELTKGKQTQEELEQACGALIAAANEAGGTDNITVVLAHFVEGDTKKSETAAPAASDEDGDEDNDMPTTEVVTVDPAPADEGDGED